MINNNYNRKTMPEKLWKHFLVFFLYFLYSKLAKDFANYFLTLKEEGHLGRNMRYFIVFFICECLNFVALYFNCHITYKFLGGTAKHSFWTYGSDVLEYWGSGEFQSKKRNPMCDMFPTTVSSSSYRFSFE